MDWTKAIPVPRNLISVIGALLTTVGAVLFLAFFVASLFHLTTNPYLGIVFYMFLPGIFVLGLLLIPLGAWRDRRRRLKGKAVKPWPSLDMNNARTRTIVLLIFAATIANVVIISLAAYSGVEYMDSVSFCGQVCHTVMQPEFSAHQNGPHARVACVQCHIGPGAPWFVRSKLSGARQVLAVTLKTYSTPIASPVKNLRPARETCEECHWPEKFQGDVTRIDHDYATDEKNTESITTVTLHVGSGGVGAPAGIHWHVSKGIKVEYIPADEKRQVIPWVKFTDASGKSEEFFAEGFTPAQRDAAVERRTVDCVDCHNRPAHTFDPTAEKAINRVMATGEMPKNLPFLKREALAALTATYPSEAAAMTGIASHLRDFYRTLPQTATDGVEVDAAITATQNLYKRNVFPDMKVTWGTYPVNIGHIDFPGCFRCHDDSHKSKDGKTIPQSCDLCHGIQ